MLATPLFLHRSILHFRHFPLFLNHFESFPGYFNHTWPLLWLPDQAFNLRQTIAHSIYFQPFLSHHFARFLQFRFGICAPLDMRFLDTDQLRTHLTLWYQILCRIWHSVLPVLLFAMKRGLGWGLEAIVDCQPAQFHLHELICPYHPSIVVIRTPFYYNQFDINN